MTGRADAKLSFGTLDISENETDFPNILDLGATTAGGLAVGVHVTDEAKGGTGVAFKVQGSADGTTYALVSQAEVALSALDGTSELSVAIPRGDKSRYLKLSVVKTGTFTAGTLRAYLDTYTGK